MDEKNKKDLEINQNRSKEKEENNKQKREDFFDLLEDKLIEVSKFFLKNGLSVFIKRKVAEIEGKIEQEIEKKIKKIINNFLQFLFLTLGFLFVFYGGFLLIMEKLDLAQYSNIIFGTSLLVVFAILRIRDI